MEEIRVLVPPAIALQIAAQRTGEQTVTGRRPQWQLDVHRVKSRRTFYKYTSCKKYLFWLVAGERRRPGFATETQDNVVYQSFL